jgi:predicted P-loop ATPase
MLNIVSEPANCKGVSVDSVILTRQHTNANSRIKHLIEAIESIPPEWALTPVNGAKSPYTKGWQSKGTSKKSIVSEIRSGKAKGYGIITGTLSGGIVAVDCDGQTAKDLAEENGYPKTVSFTSGKPGRCQMLFTIPEEFWSSLVNRKVIPTGTGEQLEIRWNGSQSVLPPSAHPETDGYYWINSPEDCPIERAPNWVIEALLDEPAEDPAPKAKPKPKKVERISPDSFPLEICLSTTSREMIQDGAGKGTRNDSGAALARDLIGVTCHLEALGHRYDGNPRTLFDEFCDKCSPAIAKKERESIWKSAQKSNGPSLSAEAIENCINAYFHRNGIAVLEVVPTGTETPKSVPEPDYEETKLAARLRAVDKFVGNRLRLNELTKVIEFDGEPLDPDELQVILAVDANINVPDCHANKIFNWLAKRNAYHPVRDYLKSCIDKHGTDTSILDGLAERYFGTSENLHQTYLKRFLIGAVARVMKPGCKLDTALFLQGDQGVGKSTFFKVLASAPWFDDSMGDAGDKDERLKMHSVWMVEWAELETLFRKKDISSVKSFLSTTKDRVRPPYGRSTKEFDRQCVIVGTTNEDAFLMDPTGSRRFWVIPVRQQINTELLSQERDKIWAAAYALYQSGERWHLSSDEGYRQIQLNEEYQERDPWEENIAYYLLHKESSGHPYVSTREVLEKVLGKAVSEMDKRHQMRVSSVLKHLGWVKGKQGIDSLGYRTNLWQKKNKVSEEKVLQVLHEPLQTPMGKDSSNTTPPATPRNTYQEVLQTDRPDGGISATPATPCNTSEQRCCIAQNGDTGTVSDTFATPATPATPNSEKKYFFSEGAALPELIPITAGAYEGMIGRPEGAPFQGLTGEWRQILSIEGMGCKSIPISELA